MWKVPPTNPDTILGIQNTSLGFPRIFSVKPRTKEPEQRELNNSRQGTNEDPVPRSMYDICTEDQE